MFVKNQDLKIVELSNSLNEFKEFIEALEIEKHGFIAQNGHLEQVLSQYNDEISQKNSLILNYKKITEELETCILCAKKDSSKLVQMVQILKNQLDSTKAQLEEKEDRIGNLKAQIEGLKEERTKLNKDMSRLTNIEVEYQLS